MKRKIAFSFILVSFLGAFCCTSEKSKVPEVITRKKNNDRIVLIDISKDYRTGLHIILDKLLDLEVSIGIPFLLKNSNDTINDIRLTSSIIMHKRLSLAFFLNGQERHSSSMFVPFKRNEGYLDFFPNEDGDGISFDPFFFFTEEDDAYDHFALLVFFKLFKGTRTT